MTGINYFIMADDTHPFNILLNFIWLCLISDSLSQVYSEVGLWQWLSFVSDSADLALSFSLCGD